MCKNKSDPASLEQAFAQSAERWSEPPPKKPLNSQLWESAIAEELDQQLCALTCHIFSSFREGISEHVMFYAKTSEETERTTIMLGMLEQNSPVSLRANLYKETYSFAKNLKDAHPPAEIEIQAGEGPTLIMLKCDPKEYFKLLCAIVEAHPELDSYSQFIFNIHTLNSRLDKRLPGVHLH